MKDLDHLCVHGREIACPECVDDARAERLEREAQRVESETKNKRRWLEASERADVLLAEVERHGRAVIERDEARALITAVAQSGVAWRTHGPHGYYVVQIDNATWDAVIDNGAEGVDIRGNLPPDPEAPRG